MRTILIVKLLIILSIMDFLKNNQNIELNKFDIKFIQELVKDKLVILFSNNNIKDLQYLVKLILLESNFGEFHNNNNNISKKSFNLSSLDYINSISFEANIQEDKFIKLISAEHSENSKQIILECFKRFNQENIDMKYIDFPFLIFSNSLLQKDIILNRLNKHSGIYCWYSKPSGNMYVGSAVNLRARTGDYYQSAYIKDRKHLPIVRAMQNHGMDQFCLIILEFNNNQNLIQSEQFWIDFITPSYNILTVAGSWLGHKHSEESKQKIMTARLGKTHDIETRTKMSLTRRKENNSFYGKTHTEETKAILRAYQANRIDDPKPGIPIIVLSSDKKILLTFKSIRETARYFKADTRTINRYLDKDQLFRKLYYITSKSEK